LEKVKYFEDCLTWNIDGSVGKANFRKGRFSLSEKVIPLILKNDYKVKIDINYLKYMIEKEAVKLGFSFSNKAGKKRIKNMLIKIPLKENKEFDLQKQREISEKFKKMEKIKYELMDCLTEIDEFEVDFE